MKNNTMLRGIRSPKGTYKLVVVTGLMMAASGGGIFVQAEEAGKLLAYAEDEPVFVLGKHSVYGKNAQAVRCLHCNEMSSASFSTSSEKEDVLQKPK